jgi:hypothetical protein
MVKSNRALESIEDATIWRSVFCHTRSDSEDHL